MGNNPDAGHSPRTETTECREHTNRTEGNETEDCNLGPRTIVSGGPDTDSSEIDHVVSSLLDGWEKSKLKIYK